MKQLFTFILLLLPVFGNAFTGKVEIDGIYYNLTTKANVAEVTYGDTPYTFDVITIPSSVEYEGTVCYVTSIGEYAFKNCKALVTINLPSSLTNINAAAFYDCTGLVDIVIPENVTSIGNSAFVNCTGLKTISFPSTLIDMRDSFGSNTNLESVYITDLAAWCRIDFWQRKCNPLNYASHLYVDGVELTDLVVPNEVTTVENSFWGFKGLKSLVIPEGVKGIGPCAFGNCDNLTSVSIANTVTKIDYSAFLSCTALKEIRIPNSVTYIGEEDFKGCTNLKEVIVGSGLEYLGPAAFSNCTELTDVYVYTNSLPETYYDDAFSNSDINYATLHVRESLIPSFKSDIPWKNFGSIVKVPEITYIVDGEIYMKDMVIVGTPITPIAEPEKEGYTFSGWSEIPETMPKEDITIVGTFTVNSYTLSYLVDDEVFKTSEVKYGTSIAPEEEPTRTGYTFSGWSTIPSTMPAHDVTVNGTFTINKYNLTYIVDNEKYKTTEVDYNSKITPEAEPTKEGHTFSGWSEIPETMPANDVTVSGNFTVNSYNLTYMVDDEVYKTYEVKYGTTITPEEEPTKTGYTFSGWSDFPSTMPAKDIIIIGSFIINKYKLTYLVDGIEYKSLEVEYNASISPEAEPTKEGCTFSGWSEIPETMPAEDVTITGTFTLITDEDNIKITSAGQSTWCSKYDLDFTGVDGLKAYIASGYDRISGTIWLTRIYQVPANEGIFLMGNAGDYKVPHISTGTYYANLMVGTLQPITLNETDGEYTNYYLSNGDSGVGFYKVNGSVDLKANRAYLPLLKGTTQAGTRFIGIGFEDDGTTNLTPALSKGEGEGEWYTLQGQRVSKPGKGLYIRNGKKVMIRSTTK